MLSVAEAFGVTKSEVRSQRWDPKFFKHLIAKRSELRLSRWNVATNFRISKRTISGKDTVTIPTLYKILLI